MAVLGLLQGPYTFVNLIDVPLKAAGSQGNRAARPPFSHNFKGCAQG